MKKPKDIRNLWKEVERADDAYHALLNGLVDDYEIPYDQLEKLNELLKRSRKLDIEYWRELDKANRWYNQLWYHIKKPFKMAWWWVFVK